MTDDESRKAFIETVPEHFPTVRLEQNGIDESFLDGYTHTYFEFWQAAVEWATKRERERCLSLVRAWRLTGDRSSTMIREIEEGEEPKP